MLHLEVEPRIDRIHADESTVTLFGHVIGGAALQQAFPICAMHSRGS